MKFSNILQIIYFTIFLISTAYSASISLKIEKKRQQQILNLNKIWDAACEVIQTSKNAKFIPTNVDASAQKKAVDIQLISDNLFSLSGVTYEDILERQKENDKKSLPIRIAKSLKQSTKYAGHLCDADDFRLYVEELGVMQFTCAQMCQRCMPGSYPVCYMKNRMFPGVAQTCLCTYNDDDPILKAAFAFKNSVDLKSPKKAETYVLEELP